MTEQMKSKIHPAMKDICEELNYFNDEFERADFKDGFTRGIKWYLKNIWHDVSEEPKKNSIIVMNNAQTTLSVEYVGQSLCGVERWAYLDDLLPVTLQDVKTQC